MVLINPDEIEVAIKRKGAEWELTYTERFDKGTLDQYPKDLIEKTCVAVRKLESGIELTQHDDGITVVLTGTEQAVFNMLLGECISRSTFGDLRMKEFFDFLIEKKLEEKGCLELLSTMPTTIGTSGQTSGHSIPLQTWTIKDGEELRQCFKEEEEATKKEKNERNT